MQGFENRDIITHAGKVAGAGKSGRTGTDDGNFFALGSRIGGGLDTHLAGSVGDIALEFADGDGFALDAAHTDAFTLGFLRTDASADSGKCGGKADHIISALHIAFFDFLNKSGDVDGNRATFCSSGILPLRLPPLLYCIPDILL